ncbi:MAG TPA: hypothetical protein VND21_08435 [Planctomycetota bacterium]|nr:hypothetical protein [Planctomycetota bacterium]
MLRDRPRSRRLFALLALLTAALLVAPALPCAEAADTPSQRYRDRNAKFSFLYFPSWKPIPIESSGQGGFSDVLDDCTVAKFSESKDLGRASSEIRAFRMGPGGVPQGARMAGPVLTGEPPAGEGPGMGEMPRPPGMPSFPGMREKPTSMATLFDDLLARMDSKKRLAGDKPTEKAKEIHSKDKVRGRLWLVESGGEGDSDPKSPMRAFGPPQGYFHLFAVWEKEGTETGIWAVCDAKQRKKMESHFRTIATSFIWFDPKAEDVESLDVLDGLRITALRRREIERTLVKGWDVVVSKQKNYIVIYNTLKGRRNDQLAKVIAERIEQIRSQVYEVQFPSVKPIEAVSIVRVCGDRTEYHEYGGPGGSAGYWSSGTEELVFYDASPKKDIDDDTLAVLYHEAFHQYIYYSVGEVAPHSWFNEGHGDYYAGAKYEGGKFKIKPFRWRTGVLQGALAAGPCTFEWKEENGRKYREWDRSNRGYSPLSELVNMSQGEYYSYPNVSYAQGWGLVYFLREKVPQNKKWKEKWGHILETYFRVLKEEANRISPLTPPVVPPVPPPGEGDEGDEPGMGDTSPPAPPGAPDAPGMGDAPPAPPGGPDAPGMGDAPAPPGGGDAPGMGGDAPGMGDDKPGPDDGEPDEEGPGIPMLPMLLEGRFGGSKALEKAVEEAFKGVDMKELEEAWRSTMKKVS